MSGWGDHLSVTSRPQKDFSSALLAPMSERPPSEQSMEPLGEQLVADELLKCHHCGYCMATCPTYRATRNERMVARGRNELVRQVAAGRLALAPDLRDPLFECLLCGACTESCFTRVKTDEVIVRAREAWHAAHGQPRIQRLIFDQLLPRPDRLTRLMRLLSLGTRSGLAELAHRLGMLRWINATLEGADGLVASMPRWFLRDRLGRIGFRPQTIAGQARWVLPRSEQAVATGPRVFFFIGCGTNYQLPRQGEAAMRLLAAAGCEVVVGDNVCCGLPPYSYGDRDAARRLARMNLELLAGGGCDLIVTECGSCSGFIKKWPALLAEDALHDQAVALAPLVRDATELLAELVLPAPAAAPERSVTYHDPCHLRRGQGVIEPPRKLLRDAAGLTLRELCEADWCCGGAGSYNIAHPELSLQILDRKLSRIEASGADLVATACPACVIQLSYGMRRSEHARPVRHITELVAEAQQITLIP